MSITTVKELAQAGWILAHAQEATEERNGDTITLRPGNFRAERPSVTGFAVQHGETFEELLVRVNSWEADQARTAPSEPALSVEEAAADAKEVAA